MKRRTITLAAAVAAGALTTAVQLPTTAFAASASATTVTSATTATSATSATARLRLRGGLTLEIPASWRVYGTADRVQVVTGACARPGNGFFQPRCDSFWIMGPTALRTGGEGGVRYNPVNGPFFPASDVPPCPTNPKYGHVIGKAIAVGYRNIGAGHKAHYRVWPGRCITYNGAVQKSTFNQREWYLPASKTLVIDKWATPGLDRILKNAVWAR